MTPGICQVCYEPHSPVVKAAQPVTRCGCGGRVVFPNREPDEMKAPNTNLQAPEKLQTPSSKGRVLTQRRRDQAI